MNISVWAMPNPVSFRYFKTSPEIIQLAVMLYVRFPLSLRNVEDLLHEVVASLTEWGSLIAS
jgi:transposase-like protein